MFSFGAMVDQIELLNADLVESKAAEVAPLRPDNADRELAAAGSGAEHCGLS